MNKLPLEKRVQVLSMLCEGSSMRSISRVCDVSINTDSIHIPERLRHASRHRRDTFSVFYKIVALIDARDERAKRKPIRD